MNNKANLPTNQEKLPAVIRYVFFVCSCLFLTLSLSGTKACQESYEFGVNSKVSSTGTPGDELMTETRTPGATLTALASITISITPTAQATGVNGTATAVATATVSVVPTVSAMQLKRPAAEFLQLLGGLSESPIPDLKTETKPVSVSGGTGIAKRVENWLGNLYSKDQGGDVEGEENSQSTLDSDDDGYTDLMENKTGFNPRDRKDAPAVKVTTSLERRLSGIDEDEDGLEDDEEDQIGTFSDVPDSDGDAVQDGAEVLSGSDPLDGKSVPYKDSDRDGLSDSFEKNSGLNPHSADGDRDGVRDDLEMALGTDPFHVDTDKDGITDGMELRLGSDPLKPEGTPIVK